jgi:hypothetical protein
VTKRFVARGQSNAMAIAQRFNDGAFGFDAFH